MFLFFWKNRYSNCLQCLSLLKHKGILNMFEINSSSCCVLRIIQFNSCKVNSNNSITSILSFNNNICNFLRCKSSNGLLFLEANLSWFVVINDCNSCSCILTNKIFSSINVIQLNKEILIWLPVVIIINDNSNELMCFSFIESYNLINFIIIMSGLSFSVNGVNSN